MKQVKGFYLRFKVFKNSKIVHTATLRKKAVFPHRIMASWNKFNPSKVFLEVYYKRGWTNSGYFSKLEDLIFAYKAFTEQSLIDSVRGGDKY